MKKETRHIPAELRAVADDAGNRHLSGYAAKYNVLSTMLYDQQLGEFYEIIVPGAFAEAVNDDVTCNIDHCDDDLLGRTPNTLRLTDDEIGLHFDCLLPDTEAGRKAFVHVAEDRKDIRSCSFAFDVLEEEWDVTDDGCPLRKLTKVKLFDTAIVIRPAYEFDTELSVRSIDLARLVTKTMPVETVVETFAPADPHAARRRLIDLLLKL